MALRFRPEGVTAGLGLVGLGILSALSNLGYLDLLRAVRHSWPFLLIVWGALELLLTYSQRRAS
ncbi:MAG TPA: DUF5668 domain-containing protein [Vicinamibacteria bacterium]|nr:DUF5668 domain-containing protein [Vicinamibacteria bacterium]